MRLLIGTLLLAAGVLAGAGGPAQAAGDHRIVHGGEARSFHVEPPVGARPAPAIVVLHGAGSNRHRIGRIVQFALEERGWAEIYPEGLDQRWVGGRADLGFLRAMVERLGAEGLIDPRRVYLAGHGEGGGMVLRAACEAPDLVAGAAVVGMTLPAGLDCADRPPVPMLLIHGTGDPVVPYGGGRLALPAGPADEVLSARETAARFALRNGCGPWEEIAITDHFPDDGTRVRLRVYRGCEAPLRHFIIDGGGHTWPGNRNRSWVEERFGRTSRDISATYEIESFFTSLAGR